jgi:hypothetical protein
VDPRVHTLERRLTMFERKREAESLKTKQTAISAINKRLEGLDRTLAALKKSATEQRAFAEQLARTRNEAVQGKAWKQANDKAPEYSVEFVPEKLPADFESRVSDILSTVKTEARKIYERYCKDCSPSNTPKKYPKEQTPKPQGVKKPLIPRNPFKKEPKMKKPSAAAPAADDGKDVHALSAATDADEKEDAALLDKDLAGGDHAAAKAPAAAPAAPAPAPKPKADAPPAMSKPPTRVVEDAPAPKKEAEDKPRKILFKPVIIGAEPTPEGMRLSKALNDISAALPVTPTYQLGAANRALSDVLGPDAVSKSVKAVRR